MHSFGPVIPIADRERIFDRYYRSSTSSNRAAGTGIGLSVAKRAAMIHGGYVWVTSDEDEGTTFYAAIPAPVQKRKCSMNQSAIRVLIVDDEPAIRSALRPPLVELGFQVAEASRGEEALQLLHSGTIDVVLLDINMPGIGGIETLRRIRAFAPRLPVLMVTVRDGEEEKVEALELGADDYVTKPFSMRELIARIRTAHRRVHAPARAEDAPIEIGEIRLYPGASQRHQARPAGSPHAQGIRHSLTAS